ncbi:MAG: L-fucose/L-arabinose isomerase family protein [Clostridia bacterium]|nr:L-fucose/L-arabinose isomerase family protein [Clostridia bacterium]
MKNIRIGLYSAGLRAYWSQFQGLHDRLVTYNQFIEKKLAEIGEVSNFGLLDDISQVDDAIRFFSKEQPDVIFLHSATYFTSDSVLPLHLAVKVPVIVLNLQPSPRIDYARTDTGEWLAQCCACPVPEISNAFERAGIRFRFVSGLLGLSETPEGAMSDEKTDEHPAAQRAWREIREWAQAAGIRAALSRSVFGFLGGNYSGMLDMYSDFTMLSSQAGIRVKIIEMCDLNSFLDQVSDRDMKEKRNEIESMFEIADDSPSDTRVHRPTDEQLDWSARVASAQEKMVNAYGLDGLAYYYHSVDGNPYEELQSGFIVGHSLLTAKGIPCAGEADLKTALAMKIGDLAGVGGSFAEIVVSDYCDGTILIGHDGPFHIRISDRKPILRGMGVYHGKKGSGISVEAKVKSGPITTLNVTQTRDGRLKLIISEAEATDGPIMTIGNTQTPVRFKYDPDTYMEKWFAEAPTHHCALTVGHNAGLFRKVGDLLDIPTVVL